MSKKDPVIYFQWMLEAVEKILRYTDGIDFQEFDRNSLIHDAVLMQFQHLGETANKLKAAYPEENSFPYGDIIGFRNYIAHEYLGIDLGEVWDTIQQDLPPMKIQLEQLISKK